jgi:hypothetical protein
VTTPFASVGATVETWTNEPDFTKGACGEAACDGLADIEIATPAMKAAG